MPSTNTAPPGSQSDGPQAQRYLQTADPNGGIPCDVPGNAMQSHSCWPTQIHEHIARCEDKDGSVAILLHELRSPLSAIRNAIATLSRYSADESTQRRIHEILERQVRQLTRLTASLCQPSGRGVENLQLRLERMDLRTVIASAVDTITPELDQRQQQLSVRLPEHHTWICGDASRLEQVFVNLLANASKYSEVGDKIAISAHTDDGHAVVEVCDAGVGIAAAALPNIFGLFVRADSLAVQMRTGRGIGLALVRSILDGHYGTVSATSAGVGQGSAFTVRLRLVR